MGRETTGVSSPNHFSIQQQQTAPLPLQMYNTAAHNLQASYHMDTVSHLLIIPLLLMGAPFLLLLRAFLDSERDSFLHCSNNSNSNSSINLPIAARSCSSHSFLLLLRLLHQDEEALSKGGPVRGLPLLLRGCWQRTACATRAA